jgi:hypothetical protein
MSPSPEKPCATIQCERTARATAKWKRAGGQPIEGRYCEECAEKLERSGDEVVWDDGLDRSGDVVELRPDQVEDRWPVVTLMKPPGSRNLRFAPMSAPPGWERANATISCRYYPADHPGVLSPDEARLLTVSASMLSEEEARRRYDLEDRLFSYHKADEGGHS